MAAEKAEKTELIIKAWPELIAGLRHPRLAMLGFGPEDVAKYLIIRGIEVRLYEKNPAHRWDL